MFPSRTNKSFQLSLKLARIMFEYLILEHVASFRVKRKIGYTKSPLLAKEAGEMVCLFCVIMGGHLILKWIKIEI